ncbi:MAG: hypothetical protein HF314_09945 [Ignavibacteria bacterium]|nr:hypothetical protein [Ignavibacteria bacterium]MCU7503387.1 hypothetical protein [Ignavibacteria bacterium]MCU7518147.1 hypothetical protein [Ignavibacteria bacterium]
MNPRFYDHIEPSIVMEGELVRNGLSIYTPSADACRISLGFGPSAYLMSSFFLSILPDPITAGKLSGILPVFFSLMLMLIVLYRKYSLKAAFLSVIYVIIMYLPFGHLSFWNRPESSIILGCTLAGTALISGKRIVTTLLMPLGIAIAVNGKFTSVFYILPLLAFIFCQNGWRNLIQVTLLSSVIIILPFLLHSSFPAREYFFWLLNCLNHKFIVAQFFRSLLYAFLFVTPLLVILKEAWVRKSIDDKKSAIIFFSVLTVSLFLIAIVAAKEGAGSHHLIPFAAITGFLIPVLMKKYRLRYSEIVQVKLNSGAILLWAAAIFYQCYTGPQSRFVYFLSDSQEQEIADDLMKLKNKYSSYSAAMGYTDSKPENYNNTFFRPLLMDKGSKYFIDAPALMDMAEAGMSLPCETVNVIRQQKYGIFILPRSGSPFSMTSFYASRYKLFNEEFREAFFDNYLKTDSSRYFTVYTAKSKLFCHKVPL